MTQWEENRLKWKAHVDELRTMDCSAVNAVQLQEVERAIRRCPYSSVSDAVMQINGGWISGREYDLCLAALLQAECLEPSGYGVFRIDRRKLPQIEVENQMADALEIGTRPPVLQMAAGASANSNPSSQPPPTQWELF